MIVFQSVLVHSINTLKGGDQEITIYCGDNLTQAIYSLQEGLIDWRLDNDVIIDLWAKKIIIWENGEIKDVKYVFRHKNYIDHYK